MVIRRLTLIFVIAIVFGAFLIVQPRYQQNREQPKIEDRLPKANWMAMIDCVSLSKEINHLLFHYKIPYRDFLTPDFVLSQAKMYGIQLQHPMFVFFNSEKDCGVVAHLSENADLALGVDRLKHFFDVKELSINKQKVYKLHQYNAYVFYGTNYICLYKLPQQLQRIAQAKVDQITPEWISIVHQYRQLGKSALFFSHLNTIQELNAEQLIVYPTFDSTHIYLNTRLTTKDTIPFQLKTEGVNFSRREFTKRAVNLHLDPSYLQAHPQHPLYSFLREQSAKIRFPFDEIMPAWNGDLCFRQGGWININETYIDHELDENFEVSEVIKKRRRQVVGMDVFYSINEGFIDIRKQLQKNGFLTQQDGKYHLLLSPPLNFSQTKQNGTATHTFYAGKYRPQMIPEASSYVLWTHKQTLYHLSIDSIKTFEIVGTLRFQPEKWNFAPPF